jgi:PAS domain S-box-containing protein
VSSPVPLPLLDLRAAVDNMAEAVLVFDSDYTILYQNAAALALSRVSVGEGREEIERAIERRSPDGRLLSIDEAPVMRALSGESVRDEEIHLYCRERQAENILLYSADPIRDESGKVVRAVVSIRDITEQRRFERKSAQQESQLRVLFESMGEPLFVVDAESQRVTTNAAFRSLFLRPGFQLESLRDCAAIFQIYQWDGAPLEKARWPVSRALKGESFSNVEVEVRRSDGLSWVVAFTGNAVRATDGSITSAVLTCRDITERKRVEQELLGIRYNLETAQNIANVGSWDSEGEGRGLWWSDQTYRIFGVPAGRKLCIENFFEFVHPEDIDRVRAAARSAILTGGDYEIEHRIIRTDGEVRYVQQRAKTLVGNAGHPARMIGSIQDITERKQAEQELSTQREQLEATFQALQDAVTVFDMSGKLVRHNGAALALTGSEPELARRADVDTFNEQYEFRSPEGEVLQREEWPVSRVLRGESLRDLELLCRHKASGCQWYFSFSGAPVLNDSGVQELAVVITRDISEMKRAERALALSESRYRTMVQSCPIGLGIGGIAQANMGSLSLVNDAFLRMTGYSREEFEDGQLRWDAITPPEWAAADLAGIVDVLEHGVASPYEKEYVRKDGSRVPVLAALALTPSSDEVTAFVLDLSDRIASERALRESEERLRMTVDAANVGTFDYHSLSGQVFLNAKSRLLWNVPPGQNPPYDSMMRSIHPEDGERVREAIASALLPDADGTFESEYRVVSPGGAIRWLVSRGRVQVESRGGERRAVRLLGINIDVTEVKERDEALREITARFETLANNISQLAWMTDREGSIYWYNQRWYDYTGTTLEQMQGWNWTAIHHPDHLDRVVERFRRSIKEGEPWEDTFPLRGKDGVYHWFLSRALPIRNEAGEIVTWFGTNTDITTLRETTGELERINRIVKLAHAAGRSGAWEWDLTTGELTWTEEHFRLFGLEPNFRPTLTLFFSFLHPDDREAVQKDLQDSIRQCAGEFRTEYRTMHSGSLHWIEQRGQVICDPPGTPVRMVGISTDVTDRKKLEQALIQSNEDLARFAYASSHDLQEPLRVISSFSSLLERRNRGRLDKESEEFLNYIVDGAARMSNMISDLLQYSQVSTQPAAAAQVDLNTVLEEALANLQPTIKDSGALVTSEDLPTVQASVTLLERVFRNLIGNSLKYRSPERAPEIHVGVRTRGAQWELSITDNGIGFKPEYAEKVFVMFKRLHGAGAYAGSGIGLAIVKRIIERHGGSVRAESQPGKGSTFYFTLPAHFHASAGNQTAGSS